MMLKNKYLVLTLFTLIKTIEPSIDGVTYMGAFDFEERYRNIHECDPIYWHPLHLPDYCADIFSKAIRSKMKSSYPVRIVRKKSSDYVYSLHPTYEANDDPDAPPSLKYKADVIGAGTMPYQRLLDLLQKDIIKDPPKTKLEVVPNLGLVAMYYQPISRKNEKAIKKLATLYAKAAKYVKDGSKDGNKSEYEIVVYPGKRKKDKEGEVVTTKAVSSSRPKVKQPKTRRRKYEKGNVVAYIEHKKLPMTRNRGVGLKYPPSNRYF